MRRTISAADAKNRLADALRQAEAGELVLITRYRKPVAATSPPISPAPPARRSTDT